MMDLQPTIDQLKTELAKVEAAIAAFEKLASKFFDSRTVNKGTPDAKASGEEQN